jgi:hypothetical protein
VGSLLFKRRNLCEIRALYRPLFEEREYSRLRLNDSKSRKYDRILHISSLIVIRRFGRDKNREVTFTKTGIVRFGPRVLNQVYLVCVESGIGRSR